jgi:hypothetical protein
MGTLGSKQSCDGAAGPGAATRITTALPALCGHSPGSVLLLRGFSEAAIRDITPKV